MHERLLWHNSNGSARLHTIFVGSGGRPRTDTEKHRSLTNDDESHPGLLELPLEVEHVEEPGHDGHRAHGHAHLHRVHRREGHEEEQGEPRHVERLEDEDDEELEEGRLAERAHQHHAQRAPEGEQLGDQEGEEDAPGREKSVDLLVLPSNVLARA